MTEIERIINEGQIPAEFLEPETRCGFLVDEERKKLWTILLDLLIKFDAVCKKYEIDYFVDGGSCLGAVRHKGFIPWDDDIDVGMMRPDYEKFSEIAISEFHEPYFWQTPETDKGYLYSCNKLRNSRTSAIVNTFRYAGFNQGIWLSVSPYDNCVLEGAEELYERIKLLNQENSAHMRRSNPYLTKEDLERLAQFPYRDPKIVMSELQSIAAQFNDQDTDYIQCAVYTGYPLPNLIYRKSDFNGIEWKDFEKIMEVPIMSGYDGYLTAIYGDYLSFPPVEERGNRHGGTLFDADKPYKDLLSNSMRDAEDISK